MDNRLTILVNSCDTYSDVWDLLFESFRVQWPNCPFRFVLNTETKNYAYKDMCISVHNFKRKFGLKDRWGERVRKTLECIDSKYVLMYLDDFVLTEPVKNERFDEIIDFLENNEGISAVYFSTFPSWCCILEEDMNLPGFGKVPQISSYKFNTGPAIWKKDVLYRAIKDYETPWQWEMQGSLRGAIKDYGVFYAPCFGWSADKPKSDYFRFMWGGAIWHGRWNPDVPDVANRYGIYIDYSTRGFISEEELNAEIEGNPATLYDKIHAKWILFKELII